MNQNFLPPKGFRDILPRQMAIRNKVISTFTGVFNLFGFQPLQTPTLEYASTLKGKYGQEADKLLYLFEDRGGREVGLNYDLTVPTARVMSANPNLARPFKRYQIQPSYRAENPQRGRYRQFTQCDIDIFGSDSPLADSEILAVIYSSLTAIGFKQFTIKLNSRAVLFSLMDEADIPKDLHLTTIQSIDKLDKKSRAEVEEELLNKQLTKLQINSLFISLDKAWPDNFLQSTIEGAISLGVPKKILEFTPSLARGLDYYTGPIFETVVKEPKIGSVTGGGRYDQLINQLGGPDLPATGTTLGLDRICDVIEELSLWPNLSSTPTVFVTVFSPKLLSESLKLATILRSEDIPTEVSLNSNDRLDKQLKIADKKGVPNVIILGEDEHKSGTYILKNLKNKKQQSLTLEHLLLTLKSS